jgi:multidrug efflux system membrane fusion protein
MMKHFWFGSRGYHSGRVVSLTAAAFLLMIGLVVFTSGCGKKEEPVKKEVVRPVKTMTIQAAGTSALRSYPGQVRASRRVDLAFKVAGPLVELPVEEGQDVKRGQLIARILPRDFKIRLEQAKAKALEAEQQYQRYRDLYVKKQVSKADFDKYKSQRDVAVARQEDAQNALKDTNLKAPFNGNIAKRYVENFEEVQAKQPIVFLQDISKVELLVNVPERDMATVRGDIKADAFALFPTAPGKRFPLDLKEYSTRADPKTQTYQVVLVMPQPQGVHILPGMTGTVEVEIKEKSTERPQIVIPAIAVLADSDGSAYTWGVDEKAMTIRKLPLKVGEMTGSEKIVVNEGLKGGEIIVVAGGTKLEDGMKVRFWEDQE